MDAGDVRIELAGEDLVLLGERAVFWARKSTLIVADTHWGKAAAFRAARVAVPEGTTGDDLRRLGRALQRTEAKRLVVLGDLLHAKKGRAPATLAAVARWRERHGDVDMLLVRGNHDEWAGDPPEDWAIRVMEKPHVEGPFAFRHAPEPMEESYCLGGHVHPAVVLRGNGGWSERLACFYFGRHVGLLPAFGSFTGCHTIRPRAGDRVFVVADGEVLAVA